MLFTSVLLFFLFESANFVKLFFFFYFVCKTELVGQNDQLEKTFFHEAFVHLIYKIKHEEELLKDILLLGKSLDFSNPLHFISTIRKMGKKNYFYDTGKDNTHKKLDHYLLLELV